MIKVAGNIENMQKVQAASPWGELTTFRESLFTPPIVGISQPDGVTTPKVKKVSSDNLVRLNIL